MMDINEINKIGNVDKQLEDINNRKNKKEDRKETRRELVIRKFKEFNNRMPTEKEIQADMDYLHRCMVKLGKEKEFE